ncbi:ABC transporter permease [Phyllobacterium sp. SB3]|uniref:ABC transporter permease n=1 Tax=Phyllobacterium sp. SB3 TaxID=3156073 RepID=UPI0032AF1425
MNGVRLRAIIVKELWAILRDPRSRIALLVPPIIQLLIFGFASTLEVKNITLGVLNRDSGYWSQEVIQRVQGSPNVTGIVVLRSEAEARTAIDRQHVIAVLRFDSSFSADVTSGKGGEIGTVFDGRRSNAAQIVSGYIDRIAAEISAGVIGRYISAPSGSSVVMNWFNQNLDYLWFTMPALIAIVGAVTTLSVVTQSVARERELGTFDQLMVSPLRVHEILIGKMVPPVLIGALVATIYIILIPLIFGVPLSGTVGLLYLALIFYLLALTGIGMLVSVLSGTQQQAFLGMFLVTIPAILLSGYASPIDNMPGWLQIIAWLNPVSYFLRVCEGVFLKAMPAQEVLANCWPLALIAVATLGTASVLFRSRME